MLRRAERSHLVLDKANTAAIGVYLAANVQPSLKATSFWDFDSLHGGGKTEYLGHLQRAIATRNVVVQRLFLIRPGTEADLSFIERVRRELSQGVDVKYLHVTEWAPSRRGDATVPLRNRGPAGSSRRDRRRPSHFPLWATAGPSVDLHEPRNFFTSVTKCSAKHGQADAWESDGCSSGKSLANRLLQWR